MDRQDVERIARATLRELGVPGAQLRIELDTQPDQWRIDVTEAGAGSRTLRVKCGRGSSAQWVRNQIFDQYTR